MTRLRAAAIAIALAASPPAHAQSNAPNAMDTGNFTNPQPNDATQLALAHQIAQLSWLAGPQTIPVGDNATIAILPGYEMLSPPDSIKFLQLNGNPATADDNADYILQNADPNSAWFAILAYDPIGHIADTDKIDPTTLLAATQILNNQDNANRQRHGQPPMALNAWAIPPSYNNATHTLEWAGDFTNADNTHTINLQDRILSRTGDLKITVVDNPADLQNDLPDIHKSLAGFAFNESQRYEDFQPTDQSAPFTLTGLISGASATSHPAPPTSPPPNRQSHRLPIAVALALILAGGWWLLKRKAGNANP